MIRFASWWYLLFIPVLIFLLWPGRRRHGLMFSSVSLLKGAGSTKTIKHLIGKVLVLLGLILAIAALARPQTTKKIDFINQRGIDIVLLLDVSGSMRSVDFKPNRLEVARKTMDDFIKARVSDRMSLVIFAGEAFTRIPLTLDHDVVRDSLSDATIDSVNQDGTAIGMAISVGLNRLKKSDAGSKIMILVTDGENNAGAIDPVTASKLAYEMGIRIYTIGIGSDTMILPVQTPFGQQYRQYEGGFDEDLLKRIAQATGGQYYRALDAKALEQIFDTIDKLEKTEFDEQNYREYNELAYPFIMTALALLCVGVFLDRFYFTQVP